MATSSQKPLPIYESRIASVRSAIWENVTPKGTFFNVTFDRTYRDENGQWKNSHSFGAHDIEALGLTQQRDDLSHRISPNLLKQLIKFRFCSPRFCAQISPSVSGA